MLTGGVIAANLAHVRLAAGAGGCASLGGRGARAADSRARRTDRVLLRLLLDYGRLVLRLGLDADAVSQLFGSYLLLLLLVLDVLLVSGGHLLLLVSHQFVLKMGHGRSLRLLMEI